jgi:hypothetical protein
MTLWLLAPARMISSMIGCTLAANRLALALATALPRLADGTLAVALGVEQHNLIADALQFDCDSRSICT